MHPPELVFHNNRGHLVAQLRSNVSRFEIDFWRRAPGEHHATSQKVGVPHRWADRFYTISFFWRLNIAKPSSLMKDEVLTSSLTKKAMVTCVNQFFMLCSFIYSFHAMFYGVLGDIDLWNASTVFRPVWLQEAYLALDRIWALLHQRPEQANAATPEGKPMTLAVKKGTESTTTQRHTTKLWNIWVIFVEFLTQGVVIQVCTFVMILWLTPLKFNPSVDYSTSYGKTSIHERKKNNDRSEKQSMFFCRLLRRCISKICIGNLQFQRVFPENWAHRLPWCSGASTLAWRHAVAGCC